MKRASFLVLGCPKNEVDAEHMMGLLRSQGWSELRVLREPEEVEEAEGDLLVIHTCGFIGPAKEEAVEAILRAEERKRAGRIGRLLVTGCLVQRYGRELRKALPLVDGFLGTGELAWLPQAAEGKGRVFRVGEPGGLFPADTPRFWTGRYTAYLKIAEGCDRRCSFCAIPLVRGPYRSLPLREVVRGAERLLAEGAREIVLVSQDSTAYGLDLEGRPLLPDLLREILGLGGKFWLRLLYLYPSPLLSRVVEIMAENERLLPYLDIPLQHASPRLLRAMGRPPLSSFLRLLPLLAEVPNVVLRSAFIVGFPGETEEDFRMLLSFLEEVAFDYAGFFAYSPEEGTPAFSLPPLPPEEVERRLLQATALQSQVGERKLGRFWGRTLEVLVEESGPDGYFRGRFFGQAPEVDGTVTFSLPPGRFPDPNGALGSFVRVRIAGGQGPDLWGEGV
jgi:ribosomal protein S12 methylthiotransferase